jgi:hypothetical protein
LTWNVIGNYSLHRIQQAFLTEFQLPAHGVSTSSKRRAAVV